MASTSIVEVSTAGFSTTGLTSLLSTDSDWIVSISGEVLVVISASTGRTLEAWDCRYSTI